MWSTAYGLIALAVVAFVVLYAALHAPYFASLNIADQLYYAKLKAFAGVKSGLVTDNAAVFNAAGANATYYVEVAVNGTAVRLPYAVKAGGIAENLAYRIAAGVKAYNISVSPAGTPIVLAEIELAHPAEMPWLEVYYLAPKNRASLAQSLRNGSLLIIGGPDFQASRTADVQWQYFRQEKAEWALVRRPDGSYVLYVAVPEDAYLFAASDGRRVYAIYVVDYPLGIPLAFAVKPP